VSGNRIPISAEGRNPGAGASRHLRRDLAWLLAIKFAALALLWLLFFSAAHRPMIDAAAASQQLAVAAAEH